MLAISEVSEDILVIIFIIKHIACRDWSSDYKPFHDYQNSINSIIWDFSDKAKCNGSKMKIQNMCKHFL